MLRRRAVSAVEGTETRTYARVTSSTIRAAGLPVLIAALLIGISVAIAVWAAEAGVLDYESAHRLDDVRGTLRDARNLVSDSQQDAARSASRIAARSDVQAAFVQSDAAPLVALSRVRPDIGFITRDGRAVGAAADGGPVGGVNVYSRGRFAGRVVVLAGLDAKLVAAAREHHPSTRVLVTVDGRVVAASPRIGNAPIADVVNGGLSDSLSLGTSGGKRSVLYAYRSRPHISWRTLWPFLAGLLAVGSAYRLLGMREVRRQTEPPPNTVRDAVALVGETLAATHNPEALLPVILQAAVEATDATGGIITSDAATLAARGRKPESAAGALEVGLDVSEGQTAVMTLYPPSDGFDADARDAAEWIAAQALIALENARLHRQVQRQAVTDELTGLANRRRFLTQLEAEVTRSSRSGSPLGIILADLDDFKRVNDSYGHNAGDAALQRFATILGETVRDVDLAVRLGGEEFAVLLPDTGIVGAAQLAERIRMKLETTSIDYESESFRVTASFGVSCFPDTAEAEELLTDADRRLYDAKRHGKNAVVASSSEGPVTLR